MTIYRSTGTLTGTIEPENVATAAAYLTEHDMTKFVADNAQLVGVLEFIEWNLHADGHTYHITAVTNRELTGDELKRLASEVSGQNSDGLGEGFEQQDFAETQGEDEEQDCANCGGSGEVNSGSDEELETCGECDGAGYYERESEYSMISFDWETNNSTFVRV